MLDKIALTLLVIGGINWGSIGLFQFDIVAFLAGGQSGIISRIIYVIVGLSSSKRRSCLVIRRAAFCYPFILTQRGSP